ncbi:Subtilisin-like protease SBT2.5 [Hibiscus syriacus]|uniref:Subtilisin-like protease SBT2.5 n=1 Tax=Hibiscus syriacus TaxID=106335 RepID=A0A6A2XGA6_HIBSY|nr:Subtilisin-like protease SBT2.5 [Hibiscus syriacus]
MKDPPQRNASMPAEIYIVTVEGEPIISYKGGENGFQATAMESDEKLDTKSELVTSYASHLEKKHDMLLGETLKCYTYCDFVLELQRPETCSWCKICGERLESEETYNTYPQFLGLPTSVWPTGGGFDRAGEDIVIGFIDSGIYPHHPSFAAYHTDPYGPVPKYKGKCEIDPDTKRDFCNGKIIGAQHFAEAAKATGAFNPAIDFASPMDGDGHGRLVATIFCKDIVATDTNIKSSTMWQSIIKLDLLFSFETIAPSWEMVNTRFSHTAAIAAGNNGIPVRIGGHEFGKASGMAPRARIAVYKALYRLFGGFVADVVAAIDQAVHDGVDILSLSVGPNGPPATTKTTFLNPFDATLLGAVKAGVFVAQAAGNGASTHLNQTYTMVAANDVLLDSSVKYSPSDCQRPEKVSETAKALGAVGFVLAVENVSGTNFDPVPLGIPGILITDVSNSMDLVDYYNVSTPRDWTGRVKSFKAIGRIGDGLMPILHKSAPQVALFSSRGPNIKDFSLHDADLLKPDILAPGALIWAAWSPNGTDEPNYVGEEFAMISGTSMATPHIAGIAALLKQKHPDWSPAAIKSALMTTSTKVDRAGRPLQAQHNSKTDAMKLVTATPFDYGSGHVDPRAALDPGLIFDAGHPSNLNTPSIAISHLVGTQTVTRTVTNVADEETYTITSRMHPSIAIETNPSAMTLKPGASRKFSVTLTVRSVSGTYRFGEITMKGSRGHKVSILVVAMGHRR